MSNSTVEPAKLPEVDVSLLPVINDLVGIFRPLAVQLGGEDCELRFLSAAEPGGTHAARVTVGGDHFWVSLSPWDAFSRARELLQDQELDRLPDDLWPAVLSAIFEPDLERLSEQLGQMCEIAEVRPRSEVPAELNTIGVEIRRQESAISGQVLTGAEGLQLIQGLVSEVPPAIGQPIDAMPLQAAVEVGTTSITLDELEQVRAHDVLIIDDALVDQPDGLVRFARQCVWRVQLADDSLTLVEKVVDDQTGETSGDPMTVRIVFEGASARLAAAQLEELGSGVAVPCTDDGVITLRVSGQVLGRGELVEIAGRRGVRLTDWYA